MTSNACDDESESSYRYLVFLPSKSQPQEIQINKCDLLKFEGKLDIFHGRFGDVHKSSVRLLQQLKGNQNQCLRSKVVDVYRKILKKYGNTFALYVGPPGYTCVMAGSDGYSRGRIDFYEDGVVTFESTKSIDRLRKERLAKKNQRHFTKGQLKQQDILAHHKYFSKEDPLDMARSLQRNRMYRPRADLKIKY